MRYFGVFGMAVLVRSETMVTNEIVVLVRSEIMGTNDKVLPPLFYGFDYGGFQFLKFHKNIIIKQRMRHREPPYVL